MKLKDLRVMDLRKLYFQEYIRLHTDRFVRIYTAKNGQEALDILNAQTEKDTIAAILLDLVMPELSGYQFMQEYQKIESETPFYGVYYGQAALPMEPDTLNYLTNEMLEDCKVFTYETGKPVEIPMYDMEKAAGKDPYEMFLSGTRPILTIENPHVDNDEELIVFRDSFGSSLVPLLAKAYEKITILDIRYVNSSMLGQFVEFGDQDVLFLYSTMLLNSSLALK